MTRSFALYVGMALILVAAGIVIGYLSGSVHRMFKKEVAEKFLTGSSIASAGNDVVTEKNIAALPEPVRKYLRYTGVVGKNKVINARFVFEGDFKLSPKQKRLRVRTDQYNYFDDLTRIFYIKGKMFGVQVVGRDLYREGKGNMIVRAAGLIPVADAKGPDMDASGLVTVFNDMCLLAPATLIDERIRWETVDPLTARGTLEQGGTKVTATLHFSEKGELVDFVTDDRYYVPAGGTSRRVRWSTPARGYRDFDGVRIMSEGEGIWHLEEGDFSYAQFSLKQVDYNLDAAAER
jgi:hypothetical protein